MAKPSSTPPGKRRESNLNGLEQAIAHALEQVIDLLGELLTDRPDDPEAGQWRADLQEHQDELRALYGNANRRAYVSRMRRTAEDD